jgi:hypothetical protein
MSSMQRRHARTYCDQGELPAHLQKHLSSPPRYIPPPYKSQAGSVSSIGCPNAQLLQASSDMEGPKPGRNGSAGSSSGGNGSTGGSGPGGSGTIGSTPQKRLVWSRPSSPPIIGPQTNPPPEPPAHGAARRPYRSVLPSGFAFTYPYRFIPSTYPAGSLLIHLPRSLFRTRWRTW